MSVIIKERPSGRHDPGNAVGPTREAANNSTSNHTQIARVKASLKDVLDLLNTDEPKNEDSMIALGLSDDHFVEPLSRHEVSVLASALWTSLKQKRGLVYRDVLSLTRKYNGKAMNLTMIYKTIEKLIARGMLFEVEYQLEGERSKAYSITEFGRQAFKMAILNAELLKKYPSTAAA